MLKQLLDKYLQYHNSGIETKDFTRFFELLTVDSEMHFENINFGPLIGKKSVCNAFIINPPSDKLIFSNEIFPEGNAAKANYSWSKNPKEIAREVNFEFENELIKKTLVKSYV